MEMFYAHQLTFEQCLAERAKGTAITTITGHLICSRDRQVSDTEFLQLYRSQFVEALKNGLTLSEEVIRSNNDLIVPHCNAGTSIPRPPAPTTPVFPPSPQVAPVQRTPTNAKGRTFSWSYSALSDFDGTFGCPLKYAESRFYCRTPYVESPAMKKGNDVHKAGEIFVRDGRITNAEHFRTVEKYARLFRGMKEQGVEVVPELEIVLDKNMKLLPGPKAWFSDDAWFRCKIDVPIIQNVKASIYDYKTGATIREDHGQLHLCMAALSIVRPELEDFSGKLIWTEHQEVTDCPPLRKSGAAQIWDETLERVGVVEDAWATENFPAVRNGLCKKYCEVFTCEHNGRS